MRKLLTAVAAMAMSVGMIGAAHAQNNCPVTETTSTGPNGETIIRREACGSVEIISSTPPATTSSTTSTTRSRTNNTPPANRPANTPPAANGGNTNSSSGGGGIAPSANHNTGAINASRGSVMSPPPGGAGGFNPAMPGDPMALRRPVARLVLFDANNFRGRNIGITQNTPDLARRRFADVASTARSQGGVWEMCSEPNYGGTCVTTDSDLDLAAAGVGDTIASVRLVRP